MSSSMPSHYKPSLNCGIFGLYAIKVHQPDDKKEDFCDDNIQNTWNWSEPEQSHTTTTFDQKDFIQKINPSSFYNQSIDNEDDEKLFMRQCISIQDKQDLYIPPSIKTNSNYGALKHKSGEPCNIFPIPSMSATDANTKIMSFVLDLDANDFCSSKLESFVDELSNTLGIERHLIDCLCVDKGSSIVWIKLKDLNQTKLENMITLFTEPNTKMNSFVDKFKLNIHKTIDVKNNKFKQVINNLQMNTNNISVVNEWLMSNINQLYPLIYSSLNSCHYKWEIVDCMVVDVKKRIDKFVKHSGYENSKLLFHGTETTSFANIINNGFWINKQSLGKWYGIGAYFTSFPVYAMEYFCIKKFSKTLKDVNDPNFCITLIGSLVNTGNIRTIYEKHKDEPIPQQYDCNHVRVFGTGNNQFGPVSKQRLNNNSNNKQERIYDEYAIRDSTRILPRYLIKLKKVLCIECAICLMEIQKQQLMKLKCCGLTLHKECLVGTLKCGEKIRLEELGCNICNKLIEISIKMKLDLSQLVGQT